MTSLAVRSPGPGRGRRQGQAGPAGPAEAGGGLPLSAAPFVLSGPVHVSAELPPAWTAGRLRLWLRDESAVLAATSLDVACSPAQAETAGD